MQKGTPRPDNGIKQDTFLTPFLRLNLKLLWGIEEHRTFMKKFNFFALFLLCVCASFNFSSCKKDDPVNDSIYGIWAENGSSDYWSLLITKDCWIFNDYDIGTVANYVKADYQTLAKIFAPNDDFCIYRYNSDKKYFILYSGKDINDKGEVLFNRTYPSIIRIAISGNKLICDYEWYENNYYENTDEDSYVTRSEIMNNNKYATVSDKAIKEDAETRTYYRVD